MYAVVLAGGIPSPEDPLYVYSQGRPKALIDMNGRSMLAHVLTALEAAHAVAQIVVVGLAADEAHLPEAAGRHVFLPNHGSLISNLKAGMMWVRTQVTADEHVLICTADIPHLTGLVVDDIVALCQPLDALLYYTVVTPEVMERRYPNARRTYLTFKGGIKIAGGDLFVAHLSVLETDEALWESLTNARKHGWKLARVIGWGTLFKFLLRRLSLEDAAAIGERILGRRGPVKIVMSPHAEMAMDGDKPHQIDLLRATG